MNYSTQTQKNKKKYLNVTVKISIPQLCLFAPQLPTFKQSIPTRYFSYLLVVVASSPTCFAAPGARRWKRTSVAPEKDDRPAELRLWNILERSHRRVTQILGIFDDHVILKN